MRSSGNKTLARQFTLLLMANLVLAGLVGVALIIYDDAPIMAAFLAAIALPGMILQPWYLALLYFPTEALFTPAIASVITLGVYACLDQSSWFRSLRSRILIFKLIDWLWDGFNNLVAQLERIFGRSKDVLVLTTKPGKESPFSLKGIDDDLVSRGRCYQLPASNHQEALWQVKLNESHLSRVIEPLEMKAIASEDFPGSFNSMPPHWWRPLHNSTTQYFSTSEFPIDQPGPDEYQAIALWNPGDQIFYLWIRGNF